MSEMNIPRAANRAEYQMIGDFLARPDANGARNWLTDAKDEGVLADVISSYWIAVFDHYTSDCVGYTGPVYMIIWGAGPQCVTVLRFNKEKGELEIAVETEA